MFAHRGVAEHRTSQKMLQIEPGGLLTSLTIGGDRLVRLVWGGSVLAGIVSPSVGRWT